MNIIKLVAVEFVKFVVWIGLVLIGRSRPVLAADDQSPVFLRARFCERVNGEDVTADAVIGVSHIPRSWYPFQRAYWRELSQHLSTALDGISGLQKPHTVYLMDSTGILMTATVYARLRPVGATSPQYRYHFQYHN